MKLTEEAIWSAITNSAKRRFDYASFEKEFPYINDAVLLHIIIDIGSRRSSDEIAGRAYEEVLRTSGQQWNIAQIKQFIEGKEVVFKREIYAAGLFGNLMHEGNELEDIYYEVLKFILTN
jgi:hypothetical protein